jgi:hypothetical protein
MIPPEHEAAAVFVAEYRSDTRADARAFSSGARARRWVEEQTEQSLDWEQEHEDEWRVATEYVMCRVRRIPLHDALTLRRRYPDAFNGEYGDDR